MSKKQPVLEAAQLWSAPWGWQSFNNYYKNALENSFFLDSNLNYTNYVFQLNIFTIQMSIKSDQNNSRSNYSHNQQFKEEEKKEPAPIQKGPTEQSNIKIIGRINPEAVRQQAQEQAAQKKGPWVPAIGIDHVSESSDYDKNERVSEAKQAKFQIEAVLFLEQSGRAISSPSKPIEKKPAIEALALNGFLSNHRGSGKQTKKIEKSDDAGLSVIQFPSINKKKK